MKKRMLLFGLLCCLLFFGMSHIKSRAFDAEEEDAAAITKELPAEDISGELNRLWNENYMQEITDYLDDTYGKSEINTGELWQDIMRGNLRGSIKEFGARAVKNLFFEFSAGREIFMNILLLAVLSALFTVVMDIVENQQVSHLGFYFLYLLLCIMLSRVFRSIYVETEEILSSVTDFVKILIPAYAAALGMTNGSATATVYYEGILFVIWCVEEVLCHVALPGIELYMLLAVMNGVWTGERLGGILQSLKRGIELLLKGVLWIVGSLGVLQAMITPVIDSLKWNTAKKVAGMVPGVGNISEGISDIFVGSAILIRNGVGVFFTIMLLFLCLVPLCKMFVLSGLVNHSRMTACSDKVAEASFLLCKVLLTGMGLFLLSIAVSVLAVSRNM